MVVMSFMIQARDCLFYKLFVAKVILTKTFSLIFSSLKKYFLSNALMDRFGLKVSLSNYRLLEKTQNMLASI
jgi:hypothetical protein